MDECNVNHGTQKNESVYGYLDQNNISDIKDLLQIFDYSYDGIALSDKNGVVFYMNEAIERITGVNRNKIVGKSPREFKKIGSYLMDVKAIKKGNITHAVHHFKTGHFYLVTTLPFIFKDEMMYFSNYREINDLNNIQGELLDKLEERKKYGYLERFQEGINAFLENEIIIKSPKMMNIMRIVAKICNTDVTVNITGESGVGKDVLAKLIHSLGNRKDKPFVEINCSLIPEHLLESELFGYTEGSFTGAVKAGKPGQFELANGGTVFLDEIGDIPYNLQVKLLKVLQDQEIMRIGGRNPLKLDLRIICATNQNLEQRIAEGRFREDLYFRINTMPIYIPPLRERQEDIIYLANLFLQKYNKQYGKKHVFSPEVCDYLESYSWPGNIRELKSLIERLVLIADGIKINVNDLPEAIVKSKPNVDRSIEISNLKDMVDKYEIDIISQAVEKYGARKAAEILEIDYSTLKRKRNKIMKG